MYSNVLFGLIFAACLIANRGSALDKVATPELKYEISSQQELKLIPDNFPKGQRLMVVVERLEQKPSIVRNLTINEQNEVVLGDQSDKVFYLPLKGYLRGEPINIGLLSADGKEKAVTTVIPYPIEVRDGLGRHLSLELSSADGSSFKFVGEGFRPNESLVLKSTTGKKTLTTKLSPTKAGRFSGTLKPFERGKTSGSSNLEISSKSGRLWLDFDWGQAAAIQ